jgi:hypothetical protein
MLRQPEARSRITSSPSSTGNDIASLQRDFASLAGQATGKDVENLEALCPGIHSMILELETL